MDIKDRRRAVSSFCLVTLADKMGFTTKKVGRKYYTIAEHDSVRINVEKNTYVQYSTGKYGDPVSFLMDFCTDQNTRFKSLNYCVAYLETRIGKNKVNIPKKQEFESFVQSAGITVLELPEKADNHNRIHKYLEEHRKISGEVVDYFIENNYLYQDKRNNCVFVSCKQNKPVFICEKGTGRTRYMKEHPGNDYDHCFYIDNKKSNVIITESIVDMMSLMTLNPVILYSNNFLSINSVAKETAIYSHLKNNPYITSVVLALDNDDSGQAAAKRIIEKLKTDFPGVYVEQHIPKYKDINEDLVKSKEQMQERIR